MHECGCLVAWYKANKIYVCPNFLFSKVQQLPHNFSKKSMAVLTKK